MPDPPLPDPALPLSPLAGSPTSSSPRAAHPRKFWRDMVRRVSRSNLPTVDSSAPDQRPPSPSTKLVHIDVTRQQSDAVRRHANHPVNASAFDDLPPAEVYDPAWNTNPLRGEAGHLGPHSSRPIAPLLPGAFTIKSSDLEDEDDDDEHPSTDTRTTSTTTPSTVPTPFTAPPPSTPTTPSLHRQHLRDTQREMRPRRSMAWLKPSTGPAAPAKSGPLVRSKSALRKPTVFETPTTLKTTAQHLETVLRRMKGEIVSAKATEIRARVPIRTRESATNVVVVSVDERINSCRVSVRRSFADSFRVSTEEFDTFCAELQKGFRELLQTAIR